MTNIHKLNGKQNLLLTQIKEEIKITAQSTFDQVNSNIKDSMFV